jgi:hypothetical protein
MSGMKTSAATAVERNGTAHPAPAGLGEVRLRELREHALWLETLAAAADPYNPRRVHAGELLAWSRAVRDLLGEVDRLRAAAQTL